MLMVLHQCAQVFTIQSMQLFPIPYLIGGGRPQYLHCPLSLHSPHIEDA